MARSKVKGTKGKPVKKAKNRDTLKADSRLRRTTAEIKGWDSGWKGPPGAAAQAQRDADRAAGFDRTKKANEAIDKRNSKRWFFQGKEKKKDMRPYLR